MLPGDLRASRLAPRVLLPTFTTAVQATAPSLM
jgi:hypothetical protein